MLLLHKLSDHVQTVPESSSVFNQLCYLTNTDVYKHRDSTFQLLVVI